LTREGVRRGKSHALIAIEKWVIIRHDSINAQPPLGDVL